MDLLSLMGFCVDYKGSCSFWWLNKKQNNKGKIFHVPHAMVAISRNLLCVFVQGRGMDVWRSHDRKTTQRHTRSIGDAENLKFGSTRCCTVTATAVSPRAIFQQ